MNSNSAPDGWDRETPRYRATRSVKPSPNSRHRHEPPLSSFSDNDVWQYGEHEIAAGAEVTTQSWPHSSFRALNRTAELTLAFFNGAMKSRLQASPWYEGRLRLDDGLAFAAEVNFPLKTGSAA